MKPYEVKVQTVSLIMHSVLYLPLEDIVPEILLRIYIYIRYSKPVKVLPMLMHYGKILHAGMVPRQI